MIDGQTKQWMNIVLDHKLNEIAFRSYKSGVAKDIAMKLAEAEATSQVTQHVRDASMVDEALRYGWQLAADNVNGEYLV
jgi:hypothetical protein